MKLSEEMAVRLHRMMWSVMQRELGNIPSGKERAQFKFAWIHQHFPSESVANDCWLCEYAASVTERESGSLYCKYCPISWPNRHCNTLDFSYAKEPISEILALPARNPEIAKYDPDDETAVVSLYYSGEIFKALSVYSGVSKDDWRLQDHVKAIREKAVEDYFKKTPGAKLATMDVDQAFKQYANEQKAPIFRALAEASGLSAGNESVSAHISLIRDTAKQNGRLEKCNDVFEELSESSGLSKGNWCLNDHVKAIQAKASKEKVMETLRKTSMQLADKLDRYKDALSKESGLDRHRPVDDHIREIVKNSMEAGAAEERDRIQEKIYEVLLS